MFVALARGWLVCAFAGAYVSREKRRDEHEGLFLGLLFGPLGVLIAALLPTGDRKPPLSRPLIASDSRPIGGLKAVLWIVALVVSLGLVAVVLARG